MKFKKIKWTKGVHNFKHGYVNNINLFSYGVDTVRSPDKYRLMTTLPSYPDYLFDSPEECKKKAEKILEGFVKRLVAKRSLKFWRK